MLTPDIVNELRKPFAAEQIKWKIQTNPRDDGDGYAVVVAYVDARDVAERLDLATGGDWSNDYALPQVQAGSYAVLECRLTVCGVTRCDVGAVPIETGGDATKDLYSDALKRAAVQFGVSSHVYRFPNVKAKAEKFGKSFYLTRRARDELLALTQHLIAGTQPPKYSEIKVTGDSFGSNGSAPTAERTQAPPPRAEGGSRTAPAPARETNGASPLQEKRAQLASLRTEAMKAGHKWNPPKSPGDMSQLEVEAAISQIEALMGAKLAHAVPVPSEKAALVD